MWVDTAAGMLLFHKPLQEAMHQLDDIDFLLLDEAPQLLSSHFDRVYTLWKNKAKSTVIMMFGDEYQLPPPTRNDISFVMNSLFCAPQVQTITFHNVFRQETGDPLLKKLAYLRINRPMGTEGATLHMQSH